jgi:hypothetical protein
MKQLKVMNSVRFEFEFPPYNYNYNYNYNYTYTYTYVYLYLHEKEIIKLLVNFLELFASFSCTQNRNRNRIPNTVPVPTSPNEYGSDRFRFRNPALNDYQLSFYSRVTVLQ